MSRHYRGLGARRPPPRDRLRAQQLGGCLVPTDDPGEAYLEVAYEVDHLAEIIRDGVVPAEPDLVEHPE